MKFYKYDLLLKICIIISKLHISEIGHYDLKDKNIFMMNYIYPNLADLEKLSKHTRKENDGIKGSPLYLGEHAGKNWIGILNDDWDDIYALGIIIYRFLANDY